MSDFFKMEVCCVFSLESPHQGNSDNEYKQHTIIYMPGCAAQLIGRLTHKSEVLGSIPGLVSFFLPLIQEGQLSVTGESICTKYWLTA